MTPRSVPSNAHATVPEYVTSSPRFGPALIPEKTKSGGFAFRTEQSAMFTQSVGVPSTTHVRSSFWRTRSGRCIVSECAEALCSRSGATT